MAGSLAARCLELTQGMWSITALRADNTEFPVVLAISPVRWADTWIFNAFLHVIPDRQEMEVAESAAPPASDAPIALDALTSHDSANDPLVEDAIAWARSSAPRTPHPAR